MVPVTKDSHSALLSPQLLDPERKRNKFTAVLEFPEDTALSLKVQPENDIDHLLAGSDVDDPIRYAGTTTDE